MSNFTAAFKPALNREGYAKLTFLGTGSQTGTKEDGTVWEIFKLAFEVMGTTRGVNQKVSIVTNYVYAIDNALGRAMQNMGYVANGETENLIEDEDGFLVTSVSEDNDGFEIASDAIPNIEQFFDECVGKIYLAKISKITEGKRKNFWEIDVDSLKLFTKKESVSGATKERK